MESLVEALNRPAAYPHPAGAIEVVETHISWIFLTGSLAYKIKKPLNLGFLDFSTLEKRHHYCNEELRLNRRLCPEIYLSVVPVVCAGDTFFVDAEGVIVDYAVKMVRFDRTMELDRMLSQQLLTEKHIDHLASMIARFHTSLPPVPAESGYGHPDNLVKPMLHNFTAMESIASNQREIERLEELKAWTMQEHQRLYPLLLQRKSSGFIRQCHGDMHTGNMVLWQNRIFLFDCIEFNEHLSNIDVISDLAFLFMDLDHGGESRLAWRLLNNYLIETGDYSALSLLLFYSLYRAMVRAKVTAIRSAQTSVQSHAQQILEEHRSYILLAQNYSSPKKPLLILTMGVSGSGKTTVSSDIARSLPCIHIRSDIERKRLAGLKPLEGSKPNTPIYTDEMSRHTYHKLLEVAKLCLEARISVIVDATFLKAEKRKLFIELAESLNTPCRILRFFAPEKLLMERVQQRFLRGNDASEADTNVLASQLEKEEALSAEENVITLEINTEQPVDAAAIAVLLQSVIA
ncbi:MAG: AAA family ATPase [Chlorobium sp.]